MLIESADAVSSSYPVAPTSVSILIASLGRQSLVDLLASIDRAHTPKGTQVEVIVADDSPDGRVAQRLRDFDISRPLKILNVGARNVSCARNALLDAATGEWALFVDDDERVDANWIAAHLSAGQRFEADAVFGPVRYVYPAATPEWFRKADPMALELGWGYEGKPAREGVTTNTLLRMATIRRLNIRFDPAFGRNGSDDAEFFSRFSCADVKMVLTERAFTWEDVPASRANPDYIFDRATRNGQSYAMIRLRDTSGASRLGFAAQACVKLALASVLTGVAWPLGKARHMRFRSMIHSNVGKLRALARLSEGDGWAREL